MKGDLKFRSTETGRREVSPETTRRLPARPLSPPRKSQKPQKAETGDPQTGLPSGLELPPPPKAKSKTEGQLRGLLRSNFVAGFLVIFLPGVIFLGRLVLLQLHLPTEQGASDKTADEEDTTAPALGEAEHEKQEMESGTSLPKGTNSTGSGADLGASSLWHLEETGTAWSKPMRSSGPEGLKNIDNTLLIRTSHPEEEDDAKNDEEPTEVEQLQKRRARMAARRQQRAQPHDPEKVRLAMHELRWRLDAMQKEKEQGLLQDDNEDPTGNGNRKYPPPRAHELRWTPRGSRVLVEDHQEKEAQQPEKMTIISAAE